MKMKPTYRDAPDVGKGQLKIECIGVVLFYFCSYFHNTENIRFSQPRFEIELYDIKKKTVKNNNLAVICDKSAVEMKFPKKYKLTPLLSR
jgi:hypothetical protein